VAFLASAKAAAVVLPAVGVPKAAVAFLTSYAKAAAVVLPAVAAKAAAVAFALASAKAALASPGSNLAVGDKHVGGDAFSTRRDRVHQENSGARRRFSSGAVTNFTVQAYRSIC